MKQTDKQEDKIKNLKWPLTLRFSLLLSIFVILLVTTYYFASKTISAKEYDSILLNLAGRQRTLIEQFAGETHRVLVGLATSDLQMALDEKVKVDHTADIFENTHHAFTKGGNVLPSMLDGKTINIPPVSDPKIQRQLAKVYTQWLDLKRIALLSLRLNAQSIEKNRFVRELRKQKNRTIAEMDRAVLLMQQNSDAKLRRLGTLLMIVTIISLVLFVILVSFVHLRIVIPLDKNIRALRQTSQTLSVEKVRAEKANQAKSEFLSRMSHELRTPLNAILGFGQVLQHDPGEPLSVSQSESVNEILNAGEHLLHLINEVLDLAKIESGNVTLSVEPVNVDTLVDECFKLVANQARNREISCSYTGMKGAYVRADRVRLKQVLLNLLSNAIKYNREGGSVEVFITRVKSSKWVRIDVVDTGIGIPDSRLTELFQPFNRLDAENTDIEGTGIGLTLSKRIVELMGGVIYVDCKVDQGCTFSIELPDETPVELNKNIEIESTPTEVVTEEQFTLLYVEDNPANMRLVKKIIEQIHQGFTLLDATTGKEGLGLSISHKPDIILLDINLPDMNGFEVLRHLKSQSETKSIPVIAVTANAMSHDIQRTKAAGFDDYISKPIDIQKFILTIKKHLPIV